MNTTVTTKTRLTSENKASAALPSTMDRWARSILLKMLDKIRFGQIVLTDGQQKWRLGREQGLVAHLTVRRPAFYRKMLFGGSIGAGEAYVDHLWDSDDLIALIRLMALNMDQLDKMDRGFAWLLRPYQLIKHAANRNSRQGAKQNILSHYDLGNEMYQSFLDPAMMYSSAIYPSQKSTLDEASLNKLAVICNKLDLKPTDRVVEIGSGWGGFAIYAASNYGCHVTTTTISDAQYQEAKRRVSAAGLSHQIKLLKKDYRDLSGKFDKLVSIEMIEAVGHKYLPEFFKKCAKLLKRDGVMLLQAITVIDQRYDFYVRSVEFLQRHIFPGGSVLSNNHMLHLLTAETDMVVRHLDDFGFDYARTLKDWRHRFIRAFSSLRKKGYDERFKRLWEYYLAYCEGGFWERAVSVVHLVATRPDNRGWTMRI